MILTEQLFHKKILIKKCPHNAAGMAFSSTLVGSS